jgi:hypothetical protein
MTGSVGVREAFQDDLVDHLLMLRRELGEDAPRHLLEMQGVLDVELAPRLLGARRGQAHGSSRFSDRPRQVVDTLRVQKQLLRLLPPARQVLNISTKVGPFRALPRERGAARAGRDATLRDAALRVSWQQRGNGGRGGWCEPSRESVIAVLAEHMTHAVAAGDLPAARIAHEAIAKLLAAPDLASPRRKWGRWRSAEGSAEGAPRARQATALSEVR